MSYVAAAAAIRPPWWLRQISALRSCWTIPGADAALRRRLLDMQARNTSVTWWIHETSMFIGALFVVLVHPAPPNWAIAWLAAVGLFSLALMLLRRSAVGGGRGASSFSLGSVILFGLMLTAVFGIPMARMYVQGPHEVRLIVSAVSTAVLVSGVTRYPRLPLAAISWIGALGAIACWSLWQVGRPVDLYLMAGLVAFCAALAASGLATSKQFVARCRAEFDAERQQEMTRLLLHDVEGASNDWFWECDAQGRLTHVSARLAEVLASAASSPGTQPARWEGCDLALLVQQVCGETGGGAALAAHLRDERPFRDVVLSMPSGAQRQWWSVGAKPLLDTAGRHAGWRGVGIDVTATFRHEDLLRRQALTDALTGLTSRHGFNEFLRHCIGASNTPVPVALMVLDLDQFKSVNDAHGHSIGDQLLRAVAQRLEPLRGPQECLARLGGDEYALVLPGVWSALMLQSRGEQLLQALRQPFSIGDLFIEVRASLGAACMPAHATAIEDLQRAADMALYAAKTGGRDAVRVYDHEVGSQARSRALITHDLAHACERQEMGLHYQLVFDAESGEPVAAEALLRWFHPSRGAIAPLAFVPLAEETGLIVPIGSWVLRRACFDAASWPRPLTVAVNLSAVQLRSRGLVAEVDRILAETGLPPQRLELELTETTLAGQDPEVADTLVQLRALGVRLALDDFGTGFSSLAYLQRFGFDRLKIDRAFVHPLSDRSNTQATALLSAIIGLADALGLSCTAEGVEELEQVRQLQRLGCALLQGWLFTRPVPLDELLPLMQGGGGASELLQCVQQQPHETAHQRAVDTDELQVTPDCQFDPGTHLLG